MLVCFDSPERILSVMVVNRYMKDAPPIKI